MAWFPEAIDKRAKALNEKIGVRFESWPTFLLGLAVLVMVLVVAPALVMSGAAGAFFFAPLWLPILTIGGAYELWYVYKRSEFIAAQKNVLLEIRPPRNLVKTPLAMETFFTTIHLTGGESTWYAKLMGGIRPFWSLEIASFEGQVHFYIWGRASNRRLVESQLYAQYPGVQVIEAVDYTRTMDVRPENFMIWGCDYKHTDSNDPLPIKTYVEFGLDKVQKEPEQIDPLANIIEFMGSMGKGEYLWLQHVIRAHKGEKYNKMNAEGKEYTWIDAGREMVEKIRKSARDEYTDPTGKKVPGFPNPTKGESEKMAAIERNIGKLAFDVGIRGIYIAKHDKVNGGSIGQLIALYKPFTSAGWNGIDSTAWLKSFNDYPWETWEEKRKDKYRREIIEAYRRRQFFYPPFFEGAVAQDKVMVMSVEELATVYHIPSRAIETPGLERIASATSEAPPNLPI